MYKDYVTLEKYHGNETEVTIPTEIFGKPVKVIGYECFEGNEIINKVILSNIVEKIDIRSFANCHNLVEVIGGENLNMIESFAFIRCNRLEVINVSNNLKMIGACAFSDCSALEAMPLQENLEYIDECAFSNSGLEKFVFNSDVEIGVRAFEGTQWLKNQSKDYIIYGDGNLIGYNGNDKKVYIPEGVKIVNGGSFDGTVAEEIYLPESVTTIRKFTFIACNNVKVYIPATVTQMGDIEEGWKINNDDAYITIYTTEGSYAQQYAKENDIPCRIVDAW